MADSKKSFTLSADLIHTVRKLSKDKAGELFITILSYINNENPVVEDISVDLVFEPIKQELKRQRDKKENTSKAGKVSAEAKLKSKQHPFIFPEEHTTESLNDVQHHSVKSISPTETESVNATVNEKQTEELIESLKLFFGFNSEMKHINKWIKIKVFMNSLGAERINHFEHQFDFYRKYKLVAKEKVHSFNNFLYDGWDSENWEKKFLEHGKINTSQNGKSIKPQTTPINSTQWDESKPRIPV